MDNDLVGGAWRLVLCMIQAGLDGDPCRDEELRVFMELKDIAIFDARREESGGRPDQMNEGKEGIER